MTASLPSSKLANGEEMYLITFSVSSNSSWQLMLMLCLQYWLLRWLPVRPHFTPFNSFGSTWLWILLLLLLWPQICQNLNFSKDHHRTEMITLFREKWWSISLLWQLSCAFFSSVLYSLENVLSLSRSQNTSMVVKAAVFSPEEKRIGTEIHFMHQSEKLRTKIPVTQHGSSISSYSFKSGTWSVLGKFMTNWMSLKASLRMSHSCWYGFSLSLARLEFPLPENSSISTETVSPGNSMSKRWSLHCLSSLSTSSSNSCQMASFPSSLVQTPFTTVRMARRTRMTISRPQLSTMKQDPIQSTQSTIEDAQSPQFSCSPSDSAPLRTT